LSANGCNFFKLVPFKVGDARIKLKPVYPKSVV